ncbi:hypothetical protein [Streptomyces sp. NPDC005507]|uniref:hypothetical protein n=1 Tax=Streptomyces sp. NPDC005507 TaxID=3154885 RepID=UPI0033AE19B0
MRGQGRRGAGDNSAEAAALALDPSSAFELARLLARHGRAIEVMRVLSGARNGDDCILHTLSELRLDQGRPADGLAHLDALAAVHGGEEDWDLYRIRLPLIAARDGVDEACWSPSSACSTTTARLWSAIHRPVAADRSESRSVLPLPN